MLAAHLLYSQGIVLTVVNIKKIGSFRSALGKRTYLRFSSQLFFYSFFDLVGFVCYYIILQVLRWRLPYVNYLLKDKTSNVLILTTLVLECGQSLVDLAIFVPLLLLNCLSPYFSIFRLVGTMQRLPVTM